MPTDPLPYEYALLALNGGGALLGALLLYLWLIRKRVRRYQVAFGGFVLFVLALIGGNSALRIWVVQTDAFAVAVAAARDTPEARQQLGATPAIHHLSVDALTYSPGQPGEPGRAFLPLILHHGAQQVQAEVTLHQDSSSLAWQVDSVRVRPVDN